MGAVLAAALVAGNAQAAPSVQSASVRATYADELDRRARASFRPDAPGCVVGVVRNGREDFSAAYGLADVEGGVALTPASRMAIASVSKQFTAFSVLLLQQDGKVRIDAPVGDYLDGLPEWGRQVTVSDLIHHTSGIRDYLSIQSLRGVGDADYYSADEAFSLIARSSLEFEPGTRSSYSNSGYFLLGRIVERVSGLSLRQFMARRIFEPLGMNDTFLQDDMEEAYDRRAYGYTAGSDGSPRRDPGTIDIVGDGGVVTTLHDLSLWDANFYDNRLGGGQALIEAALRTGTLKNGEATPHAAGLFVRRVRGQVRIGHTGFYGGFKASVQRYPDLRTTITVICNSDQLNPGAEDRWITELVIGDRLSPPETARPRADAPASGAPAPFRGRIEPGAYYSSELDVVWRMSCEAQKCTALLPTGKSFELVASGENQLTESGGEFSLTPTGPGAFSISYEDTRPIVFQRSASAGH